MSEFAADRVVATPTVEDKVRAAELRFVAKSSGPLVGAVVTALVAIALLWSSVEPRLLLAWGGLMAVSTAARASMCWRFNRRSPDDAAVLGWARPLTAALTVNGALWGLLGVSFYGTDDAEIRGFVLLVLASTLAGGTVFYAAHPPAHRGYVLGCILPIAVASFWHATVVSVVFGAMALVYVGSALAVARVFHRGMSDAIRLQHENAGLVASLRQAKDAAEAASQVKSRFLANVSHELRTPLNAVIGYSEMLVEDAEDDGRAQDAADLRKINLAAEHLLSLVNDVLDLSKIEAGKMELAVSRVDLTRLIDQVLATAEHMIETNGNTLVVEREADLGTIENDATKLRQVLLNLVSNAAKFTQSGRITVEVRRVDGWIDVAVRDTGIGIAADDLPKLFNPFSQAGIGTSGKYGGTGLGLAVSRRLCEIMGGDIRVESEPGVGSCFTMRVPAATAEARALAPVA
jgi:signal transduction histidine kinase